MAFLGHMSQNSTSWFCHPLGLESFLKTGKDDVKEAWSLLKSSSWEGTHTTCLQISVPLKLYLMLWGHSNLCALSSSRVVVHSSGFPVVLTPVLCLSPRDISSFTPNLGSFNQFCQNKCINCQVIFVLFYLDHLAIGMFVYIKLIWPHSDNLNIKFLLHTFKPTFISSGN